MIITFSFFIQLMRSPDSHKNTAAAPLSLCLSLSLSVFLCLSVSSLFASSSDLFLLRESRRAMAAESEAFSIGSHPLSAGKSPETAKTTATTTATDAPLSSSQSSLPSSSARHEREREGEGEREREDVKANNNDNNNKKSSNGKGDVLSSSRGEDLREKKVRTKKKKRRKENGSSSSASSASSFSSRTKAKIDSSAASKDDVLGFVSAFVSFVTAALYSLMRWALLCHKAVVSVVIGTEDMFEELTKNTCRETIRQILRFTNSVPAFFVSLVDDRFYWRQMRRVYNKGSGAEGAWRQFWSSSQRTSSFNALFDEDYKVPEKASRKGHRRKVKKKGDADQPPPQQQHQQQFRVKRAFLNPLCVVSSAQFLSRKLRGLLTMPERFLKQTNSDTLLFQKLDVDVSGFLEDVSVSTQIVIDRYFNFLKGLTRIMLWDFSLLGEFATYFRASGYRTAQQHQRHQDSREEPSRSPRLRRSPSLIMLKASMKEKMRGMSTIESTITNAGYPVEKHSVETFDGYILDLYRIPRRGSKDCVMFQHGMMDSAYGWVLKGDESAIAFAAYDRGFDVFLSHFRGAPPRKCKAKVSKRFWKYSFNELGMYDMTANVGKIHAIKSVELGAAGTELGSLGDEGKSSGAGKSSQYKLRVVGHSLGGAALLVYMYTAAKLRREHHIHRMVLMSPAGLHTYFLPLLARILILTDTFFGSWLKRLNFGMTMYGSILRVGAQKVAVDILNLHGLKGLLNIFCRILFGGDPSFGDVIVPYWTPYIESMPGICWGIVRHGRQIVKAKAFVLYDYGSEAQNLKHYGRRKPPNVLEEYENIDTPIDLVTGKRDGVVPSANIYQLYQELEGRGALVTYREFDCGHLNFIHQPSEEFTDYLLSRLSLP